jgi:hypothetical protein
MQLCGVPLFLGPQNMAVLHILHQTRVYVKFVMGRVQSHSSPYGICEGQIGIGKVFLRALRFFRANLIRPMPYSHINWHNLLSSISY